MATWNVAIICCTAIILMKVVLLCAGAQLASNSTTALQLPNSRFVHYRSKLFCFRLDAIY